MRQWRITSGSGVEMGAYEGATEAEALDAFARDAGYADQAEAVRVAGPFEGTVEEVQACQCHEEVAS